METSGNTFGGRIEILFTNGPFFGTHFACMRAEGGKGCVSGAVPDNGITPVDVFKNDHASGVWLSGTIVRMGISRQVSTVHVLAGLLRENGNQKCRRHIRLHVDTFRIHT